MEHKIKEFDEDAWDWRDATKYEYTSTVECLDYRSEAIFILRYEHEWKIERISLAFKISEGYVSKIANDARKYVAQVLYRLKVKCPQNEYVQGRILTWVKKAHVDSQMMQYKIQLKNEKYKIYQEELWRKYEECKEQRERMNQYCSTLSFENEIRKAECHKKNSEFIEKENERLRLLANQECS